MLVRRQILVLLFICLVDGNISIGNIVNQMRMDMVEMEREMKSIKLNQVSTDGKLAILTEELRKANKEMVKKDAAIQSLENEVASLKDPPYTFACGAYQSDLGKRLKIIYERGI